MESMDTVSLQAVTLADGSTAYIQHDSKAPFSDGQIMDGQVIQLEDGSAAYVQHVSMNKTGTRQIALLFRKRRLNEGFAINTNVRLKMILITLCISVLYYKKTQMYIK